MGSEKGHLPNMRHEVLDIKPNTPTEVTLAYPDGKPLDRQPPVVLYKLTDGRVMFVPPEARDKILAAKVRAGEPFTILKREVTNGTVHTEWRIGRTATQRQQATPEPEPFTPSRLARALCAVVDAVHRAQCHAKEIGFEAMPQFTSEDIRTMANTCLIESGRNGR
jgi:hypothetical protein